MRDFGVEDISELTTRFYDAATDDLLWADAITALKRRLNLSQVALGWFSATGGHMLYGDCDAYFRGLFFELGPQNFIVPALGRSRTGSVFQDQNLMPKGEFGQTVMFNEWFAPQDDHSCIMAKFEVVGRTHGTLTLQRGGRQPAFSDADVAFVEQLMPTLTHAVKVRRRLGLARLQEYGQAYDAVAVGFVVTDGEGFVLQHNEAAGRQLATGQGVVLRQGRLASEQPSQLAALISRAAKPNGSPPAGGEVLVTTGDDRHPAYVITISPVTDGPRLSLPIERGVMVLIQTLRPKLPHSFEARLRSLFTLTRKEASLATALAAGMTVKQAADERFISMATARTQLAQIFRKTNTTQQSQMVSLLLRVLPLTHWPAPQDFDAPHR